MLVVTGAVAFDNILSFPGRFADHILPEKLHVINISCVVDSIETHFGGTGGNQAYTLGLLGVRPILLAAAGRDFGPYECYLRRAGVETKYISQHDTLLTATGFALYDARDNQIWGFAKNAMKKAVELKLSDIAESVSMALITPDDYKALEQYLAECRQKKIPYAFDPAFDIPKLAPSVLKQGVEKAEIIFGNDYEISQLKKRTDLSDRQLSFNRIVVTTLGDKGSMIESDGKKVMIKAVRPRRVVSPTGAGDAYRAGFLAGFMREFDLKTCGQMGSLAAVYALEHQGTIEHTFTKEEFCTRYKENFREKLKL